LNFNLCAFRFRSRAAAVVAFTIAFLSIPPAASLLGQTAPLTVLSRDGRRTLATTVVNDREFLALDDVAAMFQLAVREDGSGTITTSYKGKTILLTPDMPLASISGRLVSLPAAPMRAPGANRRWLVPAEFISRALSLVYDAKLDLRRSSRLVVVGDLRVPRLQIRYDSSAGSAQTPGSAGRLTIDTTPAANGTVTKEGDHLAVKFDADALDVANTNLPFPLQSPQSPQGLIQSFHVTDAATLTFDVGPRFGAFKATQLADNNGRLVIDVVAAQGQESPPTAPVLPPAAPDLSSLFQPAAPGGSIRTIAVDPGHGGDDEGAKGAQGTKEKDITLTVARKMKAALESRIGVRVLLTRDEDRSLSIDDRTAVANNGKADLLISLHANASLRPTAGGASISTAFFDRAAEMRARALAPQRVPAAGGGSREIEFVPWDVAQIPHLQHSNEFASIIEHQLHDRVPLAVRPVESAPLRVLESANMPAVLIEMGYLTNAAQEKQLAGAEFQNVIVQALVDAVVRFRDGLYEEHAARAAK
jgi:N-acetylmuramoyl-L-alanine amidase